MTNALNKAYFLRENDPVFNGYVVKITGDSIVFKENVSGPAGKTVYARSDEEDHDAGRVEVGTRGNTGRGRNEFEKDTREASASPWGE